MQQKPAQALDTAGRLHVADWGNNVIRKGIPDNALPPARLGPLTTSAGAAGFGLSGTAGLMVDVEASTDLSQWTVMGTCILDVGTNYWISPTPLQEFQFFRAHSR